MKLKAIISHATTRRTQRQTIVSLRGTCSSIAVISLLLGMLLSPAYGTDKGPGLSDFALMMPLTLKASGALYELPLPAEVYAGVQRADLGDLALFNGAGETVPFTLVQPPAAKNSVEQQPLPLFPLTSADRPVTGDLALQVRTGAHGTSVDLRTRPGSPARGGVNVYVVDAASLDHSVSGLDFTLAPSAKEYLGTVRVAVSDDLRSWRDHGDGALALLSSGAQLLSRSRIEFPPVQARYFRLTVCPEQDAPRLTGVAARLESMQAAPGRATTRYFINPVKGVPGDYRVRLAGPLPVDRVRLVFDTDNSLAGVTVFSRRDDKSPWTERGSATFFRLRRENGQVESAALETGPTTDQEWLIRLLQPGSGFGAALPMVEFGWQPVRVIFAARGEPPYRLAFGSARIGAEILRDDGIAAALATWEKQGIKPVPATAGPSVQSGGKKALRQSIPAASWKTGALWTALILGVLLLARMAWTVGRELKLEGAEKNAAGPMRSVVEKGGETEK